MQAIGLRATPLLGRLRRRGLENPLLPLPAVLAVAVGFFLPLAVLVVYSFWPTVDGRIVHEWTIANYVRFFTEPAYWRMLLRSFWLVAISSAFTVLLSFPFAYFVAAKVKPSRRLGWILIAIIPFWTSYLIRVLAWLTMFGDYGFINQALTGLGLVDQPVEFFGFGRPAIVITFVYLLFPLSFLATYIAIERINPAMLDAAADLGAKPWRRLVTITLPTARSGIVAGFVFAFIAMMGDYATPQLIGGTNGTLYANLITNQFGYSLQWGFGATLAVLFLVTILLLVIVLRLMVGGVEAAGEYTGGFTRRRAPVLFGYSVLYLIFLYTPPALLVLLAFNDSDETGLPFVGFTTRWFTAVFNNAVLLDSLWTSLQVALGTVLVSAVLRHARGGTDCARQGPVALVESRDHRGAPVPAALGARPCDHRRLECARNSARAVDDHRRPHHPHAPRGDPSRPRAAGGARPQPGDRRDGPGSAALARFPHRVGAASPAGYPRRRHDRLCDLDGRVHPHLPRDRLATDAAALYLRVAADPGDARR